MRRYTLWAGSLLLVSGIAHAWLAEFGIEGMHVVSTKASEVRATVSPDGQRIVWGSTDRAGGKGGWDLWQATLKQNRWQDPQPLAINTAANDFDPAFSADGRWLYFFSNREGGLGGDDLYRVAVRGDGFGAVENLGPGVNSKGDEWAPAPSQDGKALLFASDGFGGAGRHDLFVAKWDGSAFGARTPVPGVNTRADEFDAAWLDAGRGIVFTRSANADDKPMQLFVAQCDGKRYAAAAPLQLSFNTGDAWTLGPNIDWNKPGELLVTGKARAPSAGQLDIYRMKAPAATGKVGCL
ncbi:TolB family protein [Lysobacter solisilvae (ex Woo and Kim 2020)]|uniref:PD40 domain-containing protein n=1 Tax=Agrilutibacter terrestris TaxID=2865112 RepID=A0A7H0FU18_9GAMM|nr:PD40 domain-containing protein [Lysobacter terrestris]QNP39534.1 PD40 domain-containing protein [Lysobacter terrestris]